MKRIVQLVVAAIVVLQLAACSSGGVSQEEFDALKQEVNALKNELGQPASSDASSPESSTEDAKSEAGTAVDVAIYTDNYVDISFIGCEVSDIDEQQLVFMVNNKTNAELTFQSGSLAIDGISLGSVFGSDSVAAQSKGKIYFETAEEFPTMTPSTLSGTIQVIDFSETLWDESSYDVAFTNVAIS